MGRHAAAVGMSRQGSRGAFHAYRGALVLLVGLGLFLLVLGAALDIGHHAGVPGLTAEALAAAGHQVTLAGIVLTAVGVALAATLRRR